MAPTENYLEIPHFTIGQAVPLSKDGATVSSTITVLRVIQVSAFGNSTPPAASEVFLGAEIKFSALSGPLDYSAGSWSMLNGNNHDFQPMFLIDGPTNLLRSGTVAPGDSFTAWMIFEAQPTGLALLRPIPYHSLSTTPPSFVIVLRQTDDVLTTGTPVPARANL